MKYYLGIDGGGTKTRFLIGDDKGNITAEYTGGSGYYEQCGLDGLTELIKSGTDNVCRQTGISPDEISSCFVGCAGYGDVKEDEALIAGAVSKGLGSIPHTIGNDCENAHAGALLGRPGINIIAGTGAISYGKNADGESARAGGWHHLLGGDEGSAYWVGLNLINEFQRQSDGRDPETLLYTAVKTILELESDDELNKRIFDDWKMDRAKIAGLAPLCGFLYDQDDLYGRGIINVAAIELGDLAIALLRRLKFEEPILVSCTGGLFNLGKRITEPLSEILTANGMQYVDAALSPACGAVILAMQRDGIQVDESQVNRMNVYSSKANEKDKKARDDKEK
ncbi:MAG: hypothetical protein IKS63_02450, partial [Firmicutes bacterium]|nr:hypothetical protein [Bacillota bacterium]